MPTQEIELKGRIVIWEDNESQLESNNHVLKRAEQVVILDPIRKKIGDGVRTYNELKFDTNHNLISLPESATYILHNVISQSTFLFKRVSSGITDVIFLLDSYKDSNRTFSQCDGRLHKIFIQNTLSSTFEVELALPTVEVNEGSSLVDIGTITIPGNGSAMIEFCWFKNGNDNKVCFSRILQETSQTQVNSSIWITLPATRVDNTHVTVPGDQTATFKKGMFIKWIENLVNKCAFVSIPSTFDSGTGYTTITLCGNPCASLTAGIMYTKCFDINQFKKKFVYAGTVGANGTNVANVAYGDEPYEVLGGDIYADTGGTTGSTTVDIIKENGTVTLVSLSLTTAAYNATPTAPASSGLSLSLNEKVYINVTNTHSGTKCVGLYVDLILFPSRLLTLN